MSRESERPNDGANADPEGQRAERARAQVTQAHMSRRSVLAGGLALGLGGLHHSGNRQRLRTRSNQSMSTRQTETIALDTAKRLIAAAEEKAREIGVPSVITVTNPEGNLVALHRMEDAWLPSVSISRQKAYTAAGFEMPTHKLSGATQPGEPLYGLQDTDQGRLVVFGGGYPLQKDGEVVGAIGSSGGSVEQDMQVAEAGVSEFESLVE